MSKGAWPPASPWVWTDSWYDANGTAASATLSFRFDSPVNGGGTNQLQGCDWTLDANCPWTWLIVVKADGTRLTQQIPATKQNRSGTITAQQLHNFGLDLFTDIGSVTVGVNQN